MKTGINYLKSAFDKENKCPLLFDTAEMLQMETMDKFYQWLHDNEWSINYNEATWFHCKNLNEDFKFSEVYQMFLKSKEA